MQKELIEKNPLLKLSFEFSLLILFYGDLFNQLHKYSVSKQLVRAGTSIGANSIEEQNGENEADFIHKIKIAAKEADETQYWLTLCAFAKGCPHSGGLPGKLTELQKIINAILGTAKRKTPLRYFLSSFIF